MMAPPSTISVCPVMRSASDDNRNNTAFAMSRVLGGASGLTAFTAHCPSGQSSLPAPTFPGATAFTRIP